MNLDINNLLNLVAEGKLDVNQANYLLNSAARFTERTESTAEDNDVRETSDVSTQGNPKSQLKLK